MKKKSQTTVEDGKSPCAESGTAFGDRDAAEAKPYFRLGAWALVLGCVGLGIKCGLDIVLDRTVLPPVMNAAMCFVLALPILVLADVLGAAYVVTRDHVERRGFFGFRRRFAWDAVTKIVLWEPWRSGRDIIIEAGRRKIRFEAGLFWWRPGFFRTAEAAVDIAMAKGIPVKTKWKWAKERGEGVAEWFDLGRQGIFKWSRAQLPPRDASSRKE